MNENQPWPRREPYTRPVPEPPPAPKLETCCQIKRQLEFGAVMTDTHSNNVRVSVGGSTILIDICRVEELRAALTEVCTERTRLIAALRTAE